MHEHKGTETPQITEFAGHRTWERIVLGENSINGTLRMIGYILVFVVAFGTIFHFAA